MCLHASTHAHAHTRTHTLTHTNTHKQVPSGELNADQLRFMGSCIKKYGDQGCADITTRAAIQLRGLTLEVCVTLDECV